MVRFYYFEMTNYIDLPSVTFVQYEINRYVFKKEKPE